MSTDGIRDWLRAHPRIASATMIALVYLTQVTAVVARDGSSHTGP